MRLSRNTLYRYKAAVSQTSIQYLVRHGLADFKDRLQGLAAYIH